MPHREVLDLAVVFYVLLEVRREGTAMMMKKMNHFQGETHQTQEEGVGMIVMKIQMIIKIDPEGTEEPYA